jgi:hypothetical protein
MRQFGIPTLMVALVLAVLLALPMVAATVAAPCKGDASTALGRADLWRNAVEGFRSGHSSLTAEQAQFIEEARKFSEELGRQPENSRAQLRFIRKAERIVEQSHELFTHRELGELYSAMGGPMQRWLAAMVAMTPFCDCYSSPCTLGNSSPGGTCPAGCQSWDDNGGTRYTGLCSTSAAE